jgi:hypothetical protein
MDSTAAFAPDSAFHPEDMPPMAGTLQAHPADEPTFTATQWLSQAMALWLQASDSHPDGAPDLAPNLAPSRTAH